VACLSRSARFLRAYVTDTQEIVFRASALSKRLPRALKSLRFCSSESPSLSSNRTRVIHCSDAARPQFFIQRSAERDEGLLRCHPFEEIDPCSCPVTQKHPEVFLARSLSISPHFGREHRLLLRHDGIAVPPAQFAVCQHLILLSDALIVTARKAGRGASGQGGEFDRHFPISVRSGQWVLHMPRHLAVELSRPQLARACQKVCDSRVAHPTSSLPSRNERHHMGINPRARPTAGRRPPWPRRFGRIIPALLRSKAACLCSLQEPVPRLRHQAFSRRCNPLPFQFREEPLACARDKASVLQ
jgi:hypothetical protein